ncbi:unnamed protein product [Schistosoma curassoni]|uniref:Sugar transferase n=1 Tax=Schistosoma curassoni TaxID=6186 RepID=A0A183KLI4_9TREM|nr:unnamed protein product [Schistosoma curassoni]
MILHHRDSAAYLHYFLGYSYLDLLVVVDIWAINIIRSVKGK